jgi:hypothetical protein
MTENPYLAALRATEFDYAAVKAAEDKIAKAYKWVRENPGAPRDEGSYYHSADLRFEISPSFRHTTTPDSYVLFDRADGSTTRRDGIRDLKRLAALRVARDEA